MRLRLMIAAKIFLLCITFQLQLKHIWTSYKFSRTTKLCFSGKRKMINYYDVLQKNFLLLMYNQLSTTLMLKTILSFCNIVVLRYFLFQILNGQSGEDNQHVFLNFNTLCIKTNAILVKIQEFSNECYNNSKSFLVEVYFAPEIQLAMNILFPLNTWYK